MGAAQIRKELHNFIDNGDTKLIKLLYAVAKEYTDDERISLEQYNKELDEAEAEIDRGEFLTHEEAVKEVRSWR
ncbi:MAG: hypothetical protein AAF363_15450 [Bacteroidota bacterium]